VSNGRRARRFGIIAVIGALALAFGVAYLRHHGESQATAKVTSVICDWRHNRMYATATVKNTSSQQGNFDLRVYYALAEHGKHWMTALAPVDAHTSKTFSWADSPFSYTGGRVTSCTGSVALEPEGND
jgi:hypothetical protein